jgi:hypothetical protein
MLSAKDIFKQPTNKPPQTGSSSNEEWYRSKPSIVTFSGLSATYNLWNAVYSSKPNKLQTFAAMDAALSTDALVQSGLQTPKRLIVIIPFMLCLGRKSLSNTNVLPSVRATGKINSVDIIYFRHRFSSHSLYAQRAVSLTKR